MVNPAVTPDLWIWNGKIRGIYVRKVAAGRGRETTTGDIELVANP
jgi:hypothetical protein